MQAGKRDLQRRRQRHCYFRFSFFQFLLILVFAFLLFFVACAVALGINIFGREELTHSLIVISHRQVNILIKEIIQQPIAAAQLIAKQFISEDWEKNTEDFAQIFRSMYSYTFWFNTSGLYYGTATGLITAIIHHNGSRNVYSNSPDLMYKMYNIVHNTSHPSRYLTLEYVRDIKYLYSPARPWYIYSYGVAPPEGHWAPMFISSSRKIFAVPYVVPIYHHNSSFCAFAVADYTLALLGDKLSYIRIGKTGQMYIADADGFLVASSTEAIDPGGRLKRLTASNATDAVTRDAARFIEMKNGTLRTHFGYGVALAGKGYLLSISHLRLAPLKQLQWTVVVLIPDSDYMASVAIAVSVVAGIVGLLALAVLSTFMRQAARRLKEIVRQIEDVVHYRDNAFAVDSKRHTHESQSLMQMKELEAVQSSISRMKIILQSFEKYIPTQLLRYLVRSNRPAVLGVEPSHATVMFLDVVNFTSMMEETRVRGLIDQFTEYSNEVIRIIVDNHGTLDKMMGDGIMAFFGCPPVPLQHHETWACRAALCIQRRLSELRLAWEAKGMPPFYVRIGLATGNVSVGNVGSTTRFQYTVLGDSVNLAARMETLNKHFGTDVLVTHSTWSRVDATAFLGRLLGSVRVKGRSHRTRVHELVTMTEFFRPDESARQLGGSIALMDDSKMGASSLTRAPLLDAWGPAPCSPTLGGKEGEREPLSAVASEPSAAEERKWAGRSAGEVEMSNTLRHHHLQGIPTIASPCMSVSTVAPDSAHSEGAVPFGDEIPIAHLPPSIPEVVHDLARACAVFSHGVACYEQKLFGRAAMALRQASSMNTSALRCAVRRLEIEMDDGHNAQCEVPGEEAALLRGSCREEIGVGVRHLYAKQLIAECERFAAEGVPEDWSPVVTMQTK